MNEIIWSAADAAWPYLVSIFLVGIAALLVGGVPLMLWSIWKDAKRPTFDLVKDEWEATASHVETRTTTVLIGNVLMPMTTSHTVIDQWTRKRA